MASSSDNHSDKIGDQPCEFQIRNRNYLYILTGVSTQEQLIESFKECFKKNGVSSNFKVSVVSTRNGLCGYGYVWIEDQEVFQWLAGEDKNGKCDNATKIANPNWKPPEKSLSEALKENKELFDDDDYASPWERIAALNDAEITIKEKYEPDMIVVPTVCNLILPPFKLTDEQKEHYREQNKLFGTHNTIPDYVDYTVTSAYYCKNKADLNQNVLIANRVPDWLTASDLKQLFKPYVSDTTTITTMTVNKRKIKDTYPFVLITPNGNRNKNRHQNKRAYVYFDPKAGEGRMIILVCRIMTVVKKMPNGKTQSYVLNFNHPVIK